MQYRKWWHSCMTARPVTKTLARSLLAAVLAISVASCGSENPTQPLGGSTPAPTGGSAPPPAYGVSDPANGSGQCMANDAVSYPALVDGVSAGDNPVGLLNCTANDIFIAEAVVTQVFDPTANGGLGAFVAFDANDPPHCTEGADITFKMTAHLAQNATSERQDIGVWIATDGGNAETGQCNHYNLIPGVEGTINVDGDQCAGMDEQATTSLDLGTLTVPCNPDPVTNNLTIGACLSWKVPADDQVCPDNSDGTLPADQPTDFRAGTLPSNKAKCNCNGFTVPIVVDKHATIEVRKACPAGTTGTFDLKIDGVIEKDDAACGETTGAKEVSAGTSIDPGADHTVAEGGFTTANYTSSYACTKNGDPYISSTAGIGPQTVHVEPNDAVVCTFTNEVIKVDVTKDATPTFRRTWHWALDKSTTPTSFTLDPGEIYSQPYSVLVSLNGAPTDDNWAVTGNIHVHNPTSHTVNLSGVSDNIAGVGAATVDCGVTFPHDLAAGATLDCTYSSSLPDATTRLNTASAGITGIATSFDGTASINFGAVTPSLVDNCIVVKDEGDLGNTDPLGTVCASGTPAPAGAFTAPKTFSYSRTVPTGPEQCGTNTYNNTATGTTNTTSTVLTDNASITVTINCTTGCTLTQGYWKTHNVLFKGGAPPDPDWSGVGGPGATFFLSGQTWFQVFWTSPKGNAYYILAVQYMAAVLNGVDKSPNAPADVQQALSDAAALFGTYTPAQIGALAKNSALRAQFITLAGVLANYNEGNGGVPHCAENLIAGL